METLEIFISNVVQDIINPLLVLLMSLALAYFIWGGAQFILNAGDPESKKKGKTAMVYGLIGLFIMTAVIGILTVLTNTFGVDLPR